MNFLANLAGGSAEVQEQEANDFHLTRCGGRARRSVEALETSLHRARYA
jgi:hypothetical protein